MKEKNKKSKILVKLNDRKFQKRLKKAEIWCAKNGYGGLFIMINPNDYKEKNNGN